MRPPVQGGGDAHKSALRNRNQVFWVMVIENIQKINCK